MPEIPKRFSRNIGIFTEEEQQKLLASTVAIIGMGCTGCAVTEFLARVGIGAFILLDGDRFDETNVNRQLFAKTSTIGQIKVNVAKNEILEINPESKIFIHDKYLTSQEDICLLENSDLLINAVDDPLSMVILHRIARELAIPSIFLLSGVVPFQGICSVIPSSGPVDYESLMNMPTKNRSLEDSINIRKELFEKITKERVFSSLSRGAIHGDWVESRLHGGSMPSYGITSNFTSLVAANEAVKVLIKRSNFLPVYAPDLIFIDGATCSMQVKKAKANQFWFQGDF